MKENREVIYDIAECLDVNIESVYEAESNLDFSYLNQHFYKLKYSLLVLDSDCISFNSYLEKKNLILKIVVILVINWLVG